MEHLRKLNHFQSGLNWLAARRRIFDEVVYPYLQRLGKEDRVDWNSLAVKTFRHWNINVILVDKGEDFPANEV